MSAEKGKQLVQRLCERDTHNEKSLTIFKSGKDLQMMNKSIRAMVQVYHQKGKESFVHDITCWITHSSTTEDREEYEKKKTR
jgi:hypothetical protein